LMLDLKNLWIGIYHSFQRVIINIRALEMENKTDNSKICT
jgi:hypothetical protein